jgi:hypothetical protein
MYQLVAPVLMYRLPVRMYQQAEQGLTHRRPLGRMYHLMRAGQIQTNRMMVGAWGPRLQMP